MKIKLRYLLLCGLLCFILLTVFIGLFFFGILHFNSPSYNKYPVRGVDVSAYQGNIDWNILSTQGITFAYIKATEGSSYVDERFEANWSNVKNSELFVGAYHFFSFETPGKTQAEHFIDTVGNLSELSLPPVIDIEYYNDEIIKKISQESICYEIREMAETLNEFYGCRPILYITEKTYDDFVKNNFGEYMIWVRSVYQKPQYVNVGEWTFWQYSNRHRLDGYNGKEPYIDMNVFNGDFESFLETFIN